MLLAFILVLPGCTEAELAWSPNGPGSPITGTEEQNKSIDKKVFECLNLDYPGLEKVKAFHESGEEFLAAQALLDYYRLRQEVVNPLISLINVTVPSGEQKIADDALEYKFYIKNYTDEKGESYKFPKNEKDSIDWSYQPNTDGEFRSQLYRLEWLPAQGKAYRATGNEAYTKSWIEVYGDFMTQNPIPTSQEYDHYGTYGALPVAQRVSNATDLFFYFIQSPNFTPAWLSSFLISLSEQVEYIKTHYYEAGNNIYIAQAFSITKAGMLFPELKNATAWLKEGTDVLGKEVSAQFLEDGMQYELDLSYHIGEVATFYDAMILARANHKEELLPASYIESMRKGTEVLMNLMYPDYSLEAFNDTRPVSWTKNVITKNLKKYVEMFPENEQMKWLAYYGKQGSKPSHLTKAFTTSGYYVLRNGWDASSTMLIHTNNSTAAWHNQGDNGTFALYRNGRHFFPDSGCFTYNNGSTREWFRSAKQHNTMTLNDKAIRDANRNGKYLLLETSGNRDVLVTENQSYPDLKHRRAIFFVDKSFFVIVDEGIGTATGKVSLNFHLCEGADSEVVYDLTENGAHTAFADNNNMVYRTFSDSQLATAGFNGKVSYNIDQANDRKAYEVNLTKATETTARFITVLVPMNGTTPTQTISALFTDGEYHANGAAVKVTINGKEYPLSYTLN